MRLEKSRKPCTRESLLLNKENALVTCKSSFRNFKQGIANGVTHSCLHKFPNIDQSKCAFIFQ